MKRLATLLSLFLLLAILAPTSFAQVCPVPENNTPGKVQDDARFDAHNQLVSIVSSSDLTIQQQAVCIATGGRQTVTAGVEALDNVLTEIIENGSFQNYLLTDFSNDASGRPISFEEFEWDTSTQEWLRSALGEFTYASNGTVSEILGSEWDGTAYVPAARSRTDIDDDGNLVGAELALYENDMWTVFLTSTSEVENGLITSTVTESSFEDNGVIEVLMVHQGYTYDNDNRPILVLTSNWDPMREMYIPASQILTEYADPLIIATTQLTLDEGMTWSDWQKVTTTLNDSGLPEEMLSESVDFFSGMFSTQSLVTYAYNSMDLPSDIETQIANFNTGVLENYEASRFSYDALGNIQVDLTQDWDLGSAQWVDASRDTYNFAAISTSNESAEVDQLNTFSIYPSPANSRVQFETVLNQPANVQIEVFDILGRSVATVANETAVAGNQRFAWSADALPAGMYFVKFTVDEQVETKSLVLVK